AAALAKAALGPRRGVVDGDAARTLDLDGRFALGNHQRSAAPAPAGLAVAGTDVVVLRRYSHLHGAAQAVSLDGGCFSHVELPEEETRPANLPSGNRADKQRAPRQSRSPGDVTGEDAVVGILALLDREAAALDHRLEEPGERGVF